MEFWSNLVSRAGALPRPACRCSTPWASSTSPPATPPARCSTAASSADRRTRWAAYLLTFVILGNTFCEIIRKNATSELNSKYFLSKKYLISAKRQAVKYRLYFFNIHGWYLSFFWENKLTKYISAYLSIRRYNNWNKIFDIKDSTNT